MVNKLHIQGWIPLQLAPYIVAHSHPYTSTCSCKLDLLISAAATYMYVGMVTYMCTLFTTAIPIHVTEIFFIICYHNTCVDTHAV